MDAVCDKDNNHKSVLLPLGGHAAAHTNLASRGLPYGGPGALATTPQTSHLHILKRNTRLQASAEGGSIRALTQPKKGPFGHTPKKAPPQKPHAPNAPSI